MSEFFKIIVLILLSSVKFVAGPPFAYINNRYDFSFVETVLYLVIGGMLGVITFTFFSTHLFRFWHFVKYKFKKAFKKIRKENIFSEPVADISGEVEIHYEYISPNSPKKIFTPRNRKLVKIWRKYGLFGIALLTPVFLSIPIGTIIANSLVNNRRKIIIYMFFSVLFWSVTTCTLFELYHAHNVKELQEKIIK